VVIPARNAAAFVAEAVESALAQRELAPEIVVVDDGSEDATRARVERFRERGVRLLSEPPRGAPEARNRGLAEAAGDYVLFLDADDRLPPGALARLAAALSARPEAVLAYGEARNVDARGRPIGRDRAPWLAPRPEGDVLRALLRRSFIASPGAVCIRRSALEASGGFRPGLPRAQDWELWCRLACSGDFVHVPRPPVLERRVHAASLGARHGTHAAAAKPAIDAVFSAAVVRGRIPAPELARLRRCQEASAWAAAADVCLALGRRSEARRALGRALRLDPRLRDALLWLRAWLPVRVRDVGAARP